MNVVNTRTLYHSLLWLSTACIAGLGFLFIQTANNHSAFYQSHSPEGIASKAQAIVRQREKWGDKKISCQTCYFSDQGWTVAVYDEENSPNTDSHLSRAVLLNFDDSGKLTRYNGTSMQ